MHRVPCESPIAVPIASSVRGAVMFEPTHRSHWLRESTAGKEKCAACESDCSIADQAQHPPLEYLMFGDKHAKNQYVFDVVKP